MWLKKKTWTTQANQPATVGPEGLLQQEHLKRTQLTGERRLLSGAGAIFKTSLNKC